MSDDKQFFDIESLAHVIPDLEWEVYNDLDMKIISMNVAAQYATEKHIKNMIILKIKIKPKYPFTQFQILKKILDKILKEVITAPNIERGF